MKNTKMSKNLLPWFNIVAFVLVVAVNVVSNALPLNGRNAGEISDALPSYFTPAGYTFSIWSLIYLALLGYIIYQALPVQRKRPFQEKIGWFFIANALVNSAWIFAWHFGYYTLSILLMITILLSLVVIYARLEIGLPRKGVSTVDYWFLHFPFSIYLGWISVATIANIASVLPHLGWNGFGIAEPVWAAIMIFAAVIVVGLLLFNRRDFAYAGVLIWALFGIRTAQIDEPLIATAAVVAAILIALIAFIGYFRTRDIAGGAVTVKMS